MSALDLTSLRAVAEAATPGPWEAVQGASGGWWVEAPNTATIADIDIDYSGHPEADAAHIATANPTTVLQLLDRLEAAEERVARVVALADEAPRCWTLKSDDMTCGEFVGGTIGTASAEFTEAMCCLPCRLRAALGGADS